MLGYHEFPFGLGFRKPGDQLYQGWGIWGKSGQPVGLMYQSTRQYQKASLFFLHFQRRRIGG
jgi:hypothetical protein